MAIYSGMRRKTLVVFSQLCLKINANIKEIRLLKKENIQLDGERHERVRKENSKQCAWRTENVQQNKRKNKQVKTEVNVCDKTIRNRLKEIGFTWRKAK